MHLLPLSDQIQVAGFKRGHVFVSGRSHQALLFCVLFHTTSFSQASCVCFRYSLLYTSFFPSMCLSLLCAVFVIEYCYALRSIVADDSASKRRRSTTRCPACLYAVMDKRQRVQRSKCGQRASRLSTLTESQKSDKIRIRKRILAG